MLRCMVLRRTAAGVGARGSLWHGIKVAFAGEDGVGDGVRREWFSLLAAELTNPDAGEPASHSRSGTARRRLCLRFRCACLSGRLAECSGAVSGSAGTLPNLLLMEGSREGLAC